MPDATSSTDPLEQDPSPERVNYATGVLLDAQDFLDEQTYHRARLARVLKYLVGMGTVAGLGVVPPDATDGQLTLTVNPGVAIDRFGRLVEVPSAACIRLARWFADQDTSTLRSAVHRAPRVGVDVGLVADVFLAYDACDRAKTPAFAAGPFDSLDTVVPARLADCYQLTLVPREENTDPPPGGGAAQPLPTPLNSWPDIFAITDPAARQTQMLQAVIGSWREGTAFRSADGLDPLREHVDGQDTSAVFLARVTIPVDLAADAPSGTRPVLRADLRVDVDNSLRPFVFMPGKWMGEAPTITPLVLP
jgi:hypothetical protein